jgi:hypothetical protein
MNGGGLRPADLSIMNGVQKALPRFRFLVDRRVVDAGLQELLLMNSGRQTGQLRVRHSQVIVLRKIRNRNSIN